MDSTLRVYTVDGNTLTLGDKIPDGVTEEAFETFETDNNGIIVLIEMPIDHVESIEFKGNTYEDINGIVKSNNITTMEHLICCGEGEDIEWINTENIDLGLCQFGCTDKSECENMCYTVDVYRGKENIGIDLAQPIYNHGLECIVVALPGYAYQVKE